MVAMQRPSGVVIGHVASFTKSLISTITSYSPLPTQPAMEESKEPCPQHPPVDPLFADHNRFHSLGGEQAPFTLNMTDVTPSRILKRLLFYALLLTIAFPFLAAWELYFVWYGGPLPYDSIEGQAEGASWPDDIVSQHLLATFEEVARFLGAVVLALAIADEKILSAGVHRRVVRMQAWFDAKLSALGASAAGSLAGVLVRLAKAVLFSALLVGSITFYTLHAAALAASRLLGLGCLLSLLVVPAAGLAHPILKPFLHSMEVFGGRLVELGASMPKLRDRTEITSQELEMVEKGQSAAFDDDGDSSNGEGEGEY